MGSRAFDLQTVNMINMGWCGVSSEKILHYITFLYTTDSRTSLYWKNSCFTVVYNVLQIVSLRLVFSSNIRRRLWSSAASPTNWGSGPVIILSIVSKFSVWSRSQQNHYKTSGFAVFPKGTCMSQHKTHFDIVKTETARGRLKSWSPILSQFSA